MEAAAALSTMAHSVRLSVPQKHVPNRTQASGSRSRSHLCLSAGRTAAYVNAFMLHDRILPTSAARSEVRNGADYGRRPARSHQEVADENELVGAAI